ncbi:unnamed protein product [Symbiodinium sp. CCMP2592]|nr:unnamed protein product [Symbiodinium sp. CCMP2592]
MQPSAKDADWRPAVGDRVFAWFYTEWHTATVRRLFEHHGEDKAEVLWDTEFSTSELSMTWLAPIPGVSLGLQQAAELSTDIGGAGHAASADQFRLDMKAPAVAAPPGLGSTAPASAASANLPPSMPPPPPPAPLSIASPSPAMVPPDSDARHTAPLTAPPTSAPSYANQAAPAAPTAQAVRVAPTAATAPSTPAPTASVAATRKTKTDTSHSDPKELQPLRELREFCDHWGFEENTRRYLVGLPAKVQKVVITNFEAPPTVQCVDALVHNFAKSILLKHGYEDLDMDQFVARWSLDDETRRYLEGLPADLKCEVLYGFHPKDGKQDPGVQIRRFTQSIADKQGIVLPPSLRLGAGTATPSSAPLANAQSGTPQSSTTASSFSQRSPTALESKQTLQEELLVFIQSWQLSPVTAQAVKSLPANLQRQVLSGFSPKKGTRNVEALLHGYIKSISVSTGGPEVKEPRAPKEAAKAKAAKKEAPKQIQPEPKEKRKEASTPGVAPPPGQHRPSPGPKSKPLGTGFAVLNESSSEPDEEEISPAPKQKAKATAKAKPVPEPKKDVQQAPKAKDEKGKKKADAKPKDPKDPKDAEGEAQEEKAKAQKEPKPGKAKEKQTETAPKDQQADKAPKAPEKSGKNQKESKQQDPKQQGKKPQDQKVSSEAEKAQKEAVTGTEKSKSETSQPAKATANTKPAQPAEPAKQQRQIPAAAPEPEPVYLVDDRPSKKRKEPERVTQSKEWADFLMLEKLENYSVQAAESLVPTPAIASTTPTTMTFTAQKPELFSATLPPPASETAASTLEALERKSAQLKELLTAGRDPDILAEKVDLQAESNSSSSKAKQKREKQKQKQLAKDAPDIRVQDLAPAGSQHPPWPLCEATCSRSPPLQASVHDLSSQGLKCEPVTSSRMRVDSPHPRKDGLLLEAKYPVSVALPVSRNGMTRLWTRISNHVGTHPAFVQGEDYDEALEGEDVEEKRRLLRERSAQIVGRKRRNQKTRIVRRCNPDPAPSKGCGDPRCEHCGKACTKKANDAKAAAEGTQRRFMTIASDGLKLPSCGGLPCFWMPCIIFCCRRSISRKKAKFQGGGLSQCESRRCLAVLSALEFQLLVVHKYDFVHSL